jgi:DNA-binding FrmR family transcriptional regulator
MAHTVRDKDKLLHRVQRIMGQVGAVKRALEEEHECGEVMQRIATARGALNSLLAEVVEGHVREHMVDPGRRRTAAETRAARELIAVVRRYVR